MPERRRLFFTVGLAVGIVLCSMLLLFYSTKQQDNTFPPVAFLKSEHKGFASDRTRLVLLLSFSDFNCPPCFDDFIMLSDFMQMDSSTGGRSRVVALFRSKDLPKALRSGRLQQWAEVNRIAYPVLIAPDSIYEQIGFTKSSAVAISPSGAVILYEPFPLGRHNRERLLTLLRQNP